MLAHRWQSKNIKTKIITIIIIIIIIKVIIKNETKNENKNIEKIKKQSLDKKPTKLPWPMSAKSENFFIQKEKQNKIIMAHECQI